MGGDVPATIMGLCCHSAETKTPQQIGKYSWVSLHHLLDPSPILKYAVLTAIPSPDYSYKSANKNPITSRLHSGSDRVVSSCVF